MPPPPAAAPRRQQHRHESRAGWRSFLTLAAITLFACAALYIALSPFLFPPPHHHHHHHPLLDRTQAPAEEPAACCRGIPHMELWGQAVKWGTDHKANSSQECCGACKNMCSDDGPCLCNSWVYCADPQRCQDKLGQCWLKQQDDPLSPDVQDSDDMVIWTSGFVYGKGVGILELSTDYGAIHIKLLPDCAPLSTLYMLEALKVRHCAGCHFFRAEGRGSIWDAEGNHIDKSQPGPPYALLQGTLEIQGLSFKKIPREANPSIKRGMVAWIDGGPEFFISVANHMEWEPKYTVFAVVLSEDMPLVEKILSLPTTEAVWDGVNIALLKKHVAFKLKRPLKSQSLVDFQAHS